MQKDEILEALDADPEALNIVSLCAKLVVFLQPWSTIEADAVRLQHAPSGHAEKDRTHKELWEGFRSLSDTCRARRHIFLGLVGRIEPVDAHLGEMMMLHAKLAGIREPDILSAFLRTSRARA